MQLTFRLCRLKEKFEIEEYDIENNFIVIEESVLEDDSILYIHHVCNNVLELIKGLDIKASAYMVPRKIVEYKEGTHTFDIDESHLTIDTINKINSLDNNVM